MEDLLFLIWFTNTSEEIDYTQTHHQERAHENPGIKSIMKGVNKAVGPHNPTCVCGFSHLESAYLMSCGATGSWQGGWWH